MNLKFHDEMYSLLLAEELLSKIVSERQLLWNLSMCVVRAAKSAPSASVLVRKDFGFRENLRKASGGKN